MVQASIPHTIKSLGACLFCDDPVYYGSPAIWVRAEDAPNGVERYAHQACAQKAAQEMDGEPPLQ